MNLSSLPSAPTPTPNATAPTSLYRPTPLEQAYGYFLLQQVFGIPFQHGVSYQTTEILVAGRTAVPFLTQSGLDRGILRTIWNVADPNHVGTLTNIDQFHLMLRLVAMTQSGLVSMMDVPADFLRMQVQQSATQFLPLATFSGVVVPSQEQLMGMYGPPISSPQLQQQPLHQMAFTSGPITTTTIDDAFGSLMGEVQDAPLGVVVGPTAAPGAATTFLSTAVTDSSSLNNYSNNVTVGAYAEPINTVHPGTNWEDKVDDDDDFGGFASAPTDTSFSTTPLAIPPMDLAPTTSESQTLGFGIPVAPSNTMDTTVTTMDISDAFSSVGAVVADAPLPSLDALVGTASATAENNPNSNVDSLPATVGGEDNEFLGYADAQAPTTVVDASSGIDDDEDEFGDFGSATEPSVESNPAFVEQPPQVDTFLFEQQQHPPLPQRPNFVTDMGRARSEPVPSSLSSAAFGLFETVAVTDAGRSLSVADAFEDIVPVQDAPLPSLDAFGSLTDAGGAPTTETVNETSLLPDTNDEAFEGDDDDDFGGFSSAPAVTTDVFQHDEPGFGAFPLEESSEMAQPAVSDLGRAMSEPITSSGPPLPAAIMDTGRSSSISYAFGDIPETQLDTPLPSLDLMGGVSLQESKDNDEFGSFASPPDAAARNDDLLGFEASVVAQTPAMTDIGRTKSEPTPHTQVPFPAVTDTRSLSISDAFGDIPAQDAPLPSFDDLGATITPIDVEEHGGRDDRGVGDDDEDDFGDFGGFVDATSSAEEAISTEANQFTESSATPPTEPDFLAFDGPNADSTYVERTISEATSSLPAPSVTESRSLSISDTFGDVGANDTFLPSFGMMEGTELSDAGQMPGLPTEDSDFPAFDDIGQTLPVPITSISQLPGVTDSARSSTLGDASPGEPKLPSQDHSETEYPPKNSETNDADFGDFSSAGFATQAETWKPDSHEQGVPDEPFSAFGPIAAQTDEKGIEVGDRFGDFGAPSQGSDDAHSSALPVGNLIAGDAIGFEGEQADDGVDGVDDDDDFGDFQEISSPGIDTEGSGEPDLFADSSAPQGQVNDDPFVGAFDVPDPASSSENLIHTDEAAATGINPDDFDDFQDFASFEQAPAVIDSSTATAEPVPTIPGGDDDDDDDWGDFEDVAPSSAPSTDEFVEVRLLRDRIRSLSLQLPETLLRKSDGSGEHVDLGEAFEVNIGVKSNLDAATRGRVDRCIQVLEFLSRDHSKLASTYWVQVFEVANDELDLAHGLLTKAKALAPDAWTSEGGRATTIFSTLLAGLAEYMRVVRSIVASVGDILLLDESAMLTIDTWASSWCSLSLLEKAVETEKKWREVQKLVSSSHGGTPAWPLTVPHSVTLQDIRSRGKKNDGSNNNNNSKICQLTLQPLSEQDRTTTMAEVSWQGRCFMACSANLLANRCPFFVVGE